MILAPNFIRLTALSTALLVVSVNAFADETASKTGASSVTVMPYAAQYSYSDTSKSKLKLAGIYGYWGEDNQSLELEYDHFSNATASPIEKDFLGIYTNYKLPAKRIRVGYHQADVTNATSVKMALAGLEMDHYNTYGYKTYGAGLNYYLSQYTPPSVSSMTPKYQVHQLSPSINAYVSNPSAYEGYFNFILTDNLVYNTELVENKHFANDVNVAVEYARNKWLWTLTGSQGNAAYVVNGKGFVIQNDASLNTSTIGTGIKYQWTPQFAIKADYEKHHIQSLATSQTSSYDKVFVGASYLFD